MATLNLSEYAATEALGRALAQLLAAEPVPCLFRGNLGSGKTALISRIVACLPGGSLAEPASPSFTLCNYYPTTPATLHCDLYRMSGEPPEDIYEFLQYRQGILLVEWAEKLEPLPPQYLDIFLNVVNDRRTTEIAGHGPVAAALERQLAAWPSLAVWSYGQHQR